MAVDPNLLQFRLPRPLASAYVRARRAPTGLERLSGQLAFEVELVRLLALTSLADYLSGEDRDGPLDELLAGLGQPTPLEWVDLLAATTEALGRRGTTPFVPELMGWSDKRDDGAGTLFDDLRQTAALCRELCSDPTGWNDERAATALDERRELHARLIEACGLFERYAVCALAASPIDDPPVERIRRWRGPAVELDLLPTTANWLPARQRPFLLSCDRGEALTLYPLLQLIEPAEALSSSELLAAISEFSDTSRPRYGVLTTHSHHHLSIYGGDHEEVTARATLDAPEHWYKRRELPQEELARWCPERQTACAGVDVGENVELLARLRSGPAGDAFRARRLDDDGEMRAVTVRVFRPQALDREDNLPTLIHRAAIRRQIHHPNLVPFHALQPSADGGALLLFADAMDGGTLQDLLADGPLPPTRAIELGCDILAALGALHTWDYYHGAVHSETVQLTADGFARLADLEVPLPRARESAMVGRPPEARGAHLRTAAADQYMVAHLLYLMLTGEAPSGTQPSPPSQRAGASSRPADAPILRALSENPEKRFPQIGDLRAALENALDELPPPRPTSPAVLSYLRYLAPSWWAERLRTFQSEQQWGPLLVMHRERVRVEADAAKRLDALTAAAALAEEGLKDPALAADLWEHALGLSPADARAAENLERLLLRLDRGDHLVALLESAVRRCPPGSEGRLELHRRLGRIHSARPGHAEQAASHWRSVLESQPGADDALRALLTLSGRPGAFVDRVAVLSSLLDGARSESEWVDVAEALAAILSAERYRPGAAEELWNDVLERRPGHTKALAHLARLRRLAGDWSGLAKVLDARVAAEPSGDEGAAGRVRLLRELARVRETHLGDTHGAVEALRAAWSEGIDRVALRKELERLLRASARWKAVVDMLLDAYESEPRGSERTGLLLRMAELLEHRLDRPDDALAAAQRAALDDPGDPRARFALWNLSGKRSAWETFCDVIEEIALDIPTPADAEYCARAARAAWFELDDPERAHRLASYALDIRPEDRVTLNILTESCTRLGRWEDLLQALERGRALDTGPEAEASFHLRLARVFEQRIGDPERALEHARKAHETSPAATEPLLMVVRLLGDQERWEEQETYLDALTDRHPQGEACRLVLLARLHRRVEGHDERALTAAQQAHDADATDPEPLQLLAVLHREARRWEELAEVLSKLSLLELPSDELLGVLREAETVERKHLERPDKALVHLRRIVEHAPDDAQAVATLLALTDREADIDDDPFELAEARVVALEASAAQTTDPVERRDRRLERARLLYGTLDRAADAVECLDRLVQEAPADVEALTRLAEIHREAADAEAEEATLDRLLDAAREPTDRARWRVRKATLRREQGRPRADYLPFLREATELMPADDEAHGALTDALSEALAQGSPEGDRELLAAALERWAASTRVTARRAEVLARLGRLRLDLGGRTEAVAALESALDADREHLPAVRLLLKLRLEDERWERCLPLVETELRVAGAELTNDGRAALHRLAGDLALRLQAHGPAIGAYERALKLTPHDVPAMRGLAGARFAAQRFDEAGETYRELLALPPEQLPSAVAAEAHRRLEEIDRRLGDRAGSLEHLEAVIAKAPNDTQALTALVPLYEQRGDWEKSVTTRRKLVAQGTSALERFNHLLACGETLQNHLKDAARAIQCYESALVIQPDSRAARIGLLDAQLADERLDPAVRTLESLIAAEKGDARKAAFHHTLALVHRDRRNDDEGAIRHFNLALDLAPTRLESFADLDAILARRGDPVAQARSYKKMLRRIIGKGDTETEHRLWYNLGQIYARFLDRREDAITALEEAVLRKPEALPPRRLLVRMLDDVPEQRERAIIQHRELLRRSPHLTDSYRALRRHFTDLGRFDPAWCAAGVLHHLGKADETEKAFYERFRTGALVVGSQPLTMDEWQGMATAADADRTVGDLLALMAAQLRGTLHGARAKDHGLSGRNIVDPAQTGPFGDLFRAVTRVLSGALPGVPTIYRASAGSGVRTVAFDPPVLLVAEDILRSHHGKQVRFELGKALAYHSPWAVLTGSLTRPALSRLLEVAVRYTYPEAGDAQADEEGRRLLRHLRRRLPAAQVQLLNELGHRLRRGGKTDAALTNWLEAVERTTNRVGFLLANDLQVAVECIRNNRWTVERMRLDDQVEDLLRYSVSEDYFKLRGRVGIQIG